MIQRNDILSIPFLKKSKFTGSFRGMRYRLEKVEVETEPAGEGTEAKTEAFLRTTFWEGPYSYDATPEEKKEYREFPFSEQGILETVDWLNEMWQQQPERWQNVAG